MPPDCRITSYNVCYTKLLRFHNRLIEKKVAALGGIKSLYSDSYYDPYEFAAFYGGERYRALKARYDPQGAFPNLYEKCVLKR